MSSDYDQFVDTWCAVRPEGSLPKADLDSLSPETHHTVEIVRKHLERCPNLTALDLENYQIVDVTPLSCLTNLTALHLHYNQIVDVTPLSCLTNLTYLVLSFNKIVDVTPLSNLTNLTKLSLYDNEIADVTGLSKLTNLTALHLGNNQIADVTPLITLRNLTRLDLSCYKIADLTPLENLTNLTWLCLYDNEIADVTPLSKLTNLTELYLSGVRPLDLSPLTSLTHLEVSWNGVDIPQKYWVPVEQWSSRWILTESNAELRSLFIQILGYEKIAQELSAQELDRYREYSLLKIPITQESEKNDDSEEDIYLLKMTCPSTGHIHMLRVPPDVNSASEAITWVNWGIHPEEFAIET